MIKKRLMTPGPVDVPPSVLAAASQPAPHHRTPEYRKILKEVQEGLQEVFQTKHRVLVFGSSGTGAMEAAMINLVSPGESVLVASGGAFGERWADLAKTYGIETTHVKGEWGEGLKPADLRKALQEKKGIKAAFMTLSETSTGVDHPIQELASVCREFNVLCVVDAISGMGAAPLKTDEWGVDVVVVGSQKALMIPPGLAFAAVGENAWKAVEANPRPRYYFDFQKSRKAWEKDELPDTPFTSSTSLILQLKEALRLILAEGVNAVWNRHERLALMTRTGAAAMGLHLFAKDHASRVLTSIHVPDGVDGKKLVKMIRDEYGLSLAGGQKHLEGKIFRVGHVGYLDQFDIITAMTAVELALHRLGFSVKFGKAQEAIQSLQVKIQPSA